MWHRVWENEDITTAGVRRGKKVQYYRRKHKALDWEFLCLALVQRDGKEITYQATARWEGDAYRIYIWRGNRLIEKHEVDTSDLNVYQRFNLVFTFFRRAVGEEGDIAFYVYKSRYNPATDNAIWMEVSI